MPEPWLAHRVLVQAGDGGVVVLENGQVKRYQFLVGYDVCRRPHT